MSDESRDSKLKVIDRRWFTEEGELRKPIPMDEESGGAAPEQTAAPAAEAPPPSTPLQGAESARPTFEDSVASPAHLGLVDLIDALAQPAAALLGGQIPGRGRDLEGARYYIDLLAVVQERMGSQLSAEESRYLEDVLYQLRSLYVSATR